MKCDSSSFPSFRLGNRTSPSQRTQTEVGIDGLYDSSVDSVVPLADLESPTTINCILTLPGTNYTKKRETIFYGKSPFLIFPPINVRDIRHFSLRLYFVGETFTYITCRFRFICDNCFLLLYFGSLLTTFRWFAFILTRLKLTTTNHEAHV